MAMHAFVDVVAVAALIISCVQGSSIVSDDVSDDEVLDCPESCSKCECCKNLRTDTFPNLHLQFNCSYPDVIRVVKPPETEQSATFRLFLSNQCITRIPENICDFPNIVSIQMTDNFIKYVPSLSCLTNLVALDLSNNEIEHITADTFAGLERLRHINLGWNRIHTIEINTFRSDQRSLMNVLLYRNQLQTMEMAWPMSIKHSFCKFDVSYNNLSHLSNKEDWSIRMDESYGPGMVDLSNNLFTTWFTEQLKIYGIKNLAMLGKFMTWGFDFRDNPWVCDCKLFTFLKLTSNFPQVQRLEYFNVVCQSPPQLKGIPVVDVDLTSLVCDVTDQCPSECSCQYQPIHQHVLVDCRHRHLHRLPFKLPSGTIKLLIQNNSIESLEQRSFLSRTHYMDLSNNGLKYVDYSAVGMLRNVRHLNLSNNNLTRLPETFINIPLFRLSLDNNSFICDCNTTWMYTWLKHQSSELNVSQMVCHAGGVNVVPVTTADDDFLRCRKPDPFPVALSITFGVVSIVFIVTGVLIVRFRYEVALLLHTYFGKLRNTINDDSDHDLFVSIEDDSDIDRQWAVKELLPQMEKHRNIKLYFPPRDMDPGSVTIDETIKILKKSRATLVYLSADYLKNPSKLYEFSEAFKIMIKERRGRIIMVKSKDTEAEKPGYLTAILRLNRFLDLDDKNLFDNILHELGQDKRKDKCVRSTSQFSVITE